MTGVKVLQTENSRTVLMGEIVNVEGDEEEEEGEDAPEKYRQFLASGIATLGALCTGMCLSWSSAATPMLLEEDSHIKVTITQAAWISSLVTLGGFVGAIPTGMIVNKLGRKTSLQLLAVPIFTSWMILSFTECIYGLYAARFAAGFAGGAISVAAPMYVAEIAHASVRGTLGTLFQLQITIGLLLEYILGGVIPGFKILALVSSFPSVAFLIGISFMPETPLFLYSKNRAVDARKSLMYFRGATYSIEEELMSVAEEIKKSSANKAKISDLFDGRAARKSFVIALGCMFFQQFSGINAVLFYAADIFKMTGSGLSPTVCAVLMGVVQVIATLFSTILIDRTGRKLLLFISAFVMFLCLITLGVYFHLKQTQDLASLSMLPIASLAIFVIVFSIGFGPIPWMLMAEILQPKIKSLASSICAAVSWLLGFVVANQFQNLVANLGLGITFGIFGVICGIGALFVVFLVPETRGKDVAEVQRILEGDKPKQNGNKSRGCSSSCSCDRDKTTSV